MWQLKTLHWKLVGVFKGWVLMLWQQLSKEPTQSTTLNWSFNNCIYTVILVYCFVDMNVTAEHTALYTCTHTHTHTRTQKVCFVMCNILLRVDIRNAWVDLEMLLKLFWQGVMCTSLSDFTQIDVESVCSVNIILAKHKEKCHSFKW